MNVYRDDIVLLSQNSTEKLLATLLTDDNSIVLRNEFISDIQQNISYLDDGSIVVDVPEIDLIDCENYEHVNATFGTQTISIRIQDAKKLNTWDKDVFMHNYNQNEENKKSKYVVKKTETNCTWKTNTKQLSKVS